MDQRQLDHLGPSAASLIASSEACSRACATAMRRPESGWTLGEVMAWLLEADPTKASQLLPDWAGAVKNQLWRHAGSWASRAIASGRYL